LSCKRKRPGSWPWLTGQCPRDRDCNGGRGNVAELAWEAKVVEGVPRWEQRVPMLGWEALAQGRV
jgi:hypothetical protein